MVTYTALDYAGPIELKAILGESSRLSYRASCGGLWSLAFGSNQKNLYQEDHLGRRKSFRLFRLLPLVTGRHIAGSTLLPYANWLHLNAFVSGQAVAGNLASSFQFSQFFSQFNIKFTMKHLAKNMDHRSRFAFCWDSQLGKI